MNIVVIVLLGIVFAGLVLLVSSLDIPLWTIVLVVAGIFFVGQMVAVYTPSKTRIPVPSGQKSGGGSALPLRPKGSSKASGQTGGSTTSTRTESMEDRLARINAGLGNPSQPKAPRGDGSKLESQPISPEGTVQNQAEIDKAKADNKKIEEENKGIEDKNKEEQQRFNDDTKKAEADRDAKIKKLEEDNEKKQVDEHKKKVEEVKEENAKAKNKYNEQLVDFKKGKESHKKAVKDFKKKQAAALEYDKEEEKRSTRNKKAQAKNKKQDKEYEAALREYTDNQVAVNKRRSDIEIKGVTDNAFIRDVRKYLKLEVKETSKIKQDANAAAQKTLKSHTKKDIRDTLRRKPATQLKSLGYDDERDDWQDQISRLIKDKPIDLARLTVGVGGLSKNTTPDPLTDQEKRDYIGSAGPEPKKPKPAAITPSSGERPVVPEEPTEFVGTAPVEPKLATVPALKINPVPARVLAGVKAATVPPVRVLVPTKKVAVPAVVRSAPVRSAKVKVAGVKAKVMRKRVYAGNDEIDEDDIDSDDFDSDDFKGDYEDLNSDDGTSGK